MNTSHCFGGAWTQSKLNRLSKYLSEYMKIFKANEKARYFSTFYVDAFAGTGHRSDPNNSYDQCLFGDDDAVEFQQGSAKIALDTKPSFDHFIFIDTNPVFIEELNSLKESYRDKDIHIECEDCNYYLQRWCKSMDWRRNRAVVFLDPYGAQVDWKTIECIAATKAIDLWLLFPLGQAVNRMLARKGPDPSWAKRLDRFFGTTDWWDAFYKPSPQMGLFDEEPTMEKTANFKSISDYFVKRLKTVFAGVANRPLELCNSKNIPIFMLCFASANPKGAKTAIRIADYILRH